MTAEDRQPTRRDLIDAQRAIFRNQDEDERMGIREETAEYNALHDRYYDLEWRMPAKESRGVWDQAYNEHSMANGDGGHLHIAWGQPKQDRMWWRHDEDEAER